MSDSDNIRRATIFVLIVAMLLLGYVLFTSAKWRQTAVIYAVFAGLSIIGAIAWPYLTGEK